MSDPSVHPAQPPPEQQAIRAKCFHPTGTFIEFAKEEIEQSIPARFEKMVCLFSHHRVAACGFPTSYKGLSGAQL
jgi:hypothetical protein